MYANMIYSGTKPALYCIITGNFQMRIFEDTVNGVHFWIRIFENTVNRVYICEFNFVDQIRFITRKDDIKEM